MRKRNIDIGVNAVGGDDITMIIYVTFISSDMCRIPYFTRFYVPMFVPMRVGDCCESLR